MDSKPATRITELDGVRGCAILMVMLYHFGPKSLAHATAAKQIMQYAGGIGWFGVELFFVLSGFLITGILLDSRSASNYYRVFYWRRAVRILPLYYTAVAVYFLIVPFASHRLGFSWQPVSPWEQVWYWFHVSNWRTAFHPLAYGPVTHFWSLAVEEQFYFIWPVVVLACSRRTLLRVCSIVIVACCLLRCLPPFQAINVRYPDFLYRLTPFRMDSLIIGALAAVLVRDAAWNQMAQRFLPAVLGCGTILLGVAVAAAGSTVYNSAPMSSYGYSALAIVFGALVLYAYWLSGSAHPLAVVLRSRPLVICGKYSYAMYIVHAQVWFLLSPHVPDLDLIPATLVRMVAGTVATLAVAWVSWQCLERHFLRLRNAIAHRFPQALHVSV